MTGIIISCAMVSVIRGKRVITFSNILQHKTFPLAEILSTLLEIGQQEMNNPIEIEFAANLETPAGTPKIFNFLQIRPIVHTEEAHNINLDHIKPEETIIYSESALGNGVFKGITILFMLNRNLLMLQIIKMLPLDIEKINCFVCKTGERICTDWSGKMGFN